MMHCVAPRFSSIDLQVAWSAVFRDCSRRRSSESDLTIARATASRARSSPRFFPIDLQVAWSAVFCTCCRRRSSEFDLALACASAFRVRSSPRFSSFALQVARLSVFLNRSLARILSLLLLWERAAEFRERASSATSKLLVRAKAMCCALRVVICDAFWAYWARLRQSAAGGAALEIKMICAAFSLFCC